MRRAPHVPQTEHEFRSGKRKEMKEARKAMGNLRNACAFLPHEAYQAILEADEKLDQAHKACIDWWKDY